MKLILWHHFLFKTTIKGMQCNTRSLCPHLVTMSSLGHYVLTWSVCPHLVTMSSLELWSPPWMKNVYQARNSICLQPSYMTILSLILRNDVTLLSVTLQDVYFLCQSQDSFVNVWENTQVTLTILLFSMRDQVYTNEHNLHQFSSA